MAGKDLHDKPFDQGTLTKLEIFEKYTQAWLPVFAITKGSEILIVDFFAGTGYDVNGVPGSPIRILSKILEFAPLLIKYRTKVILHLNEFKKSKLALLKEACNKYIEDHPILKKVLQIDFTALDFVESFKSEYTLIERLPALVFLDQNGVKFLNKTYLIKLEQTRVTDFLYFVSTSYLKRFRNTPEFKAFGIDMDFITNNPFRFIHQSLMDILRSWLPVSSKLKLYPFTIKKPSGIYGLVFGASHPAAVVKFLEISWKQNELNGSANFDIDEDINKGQMDLFSGKKLTKKELFQRNLEEAVLSGEVKSNVDAFFFTLDRGHIPVHAKEVLDRLKKGKLVAYKSSSPLITYENVCKNKVRQDYLLSKKR